jgi:hypothetical protein
MHRDSKLISAKIYVLCSYIVYTAAEFISLNIIGSNPKV